MAAWRTSVIIGASEIGWNWFACASKGLTPIRECQKVTRFAHAAERVAQGAANAKTPLLFRSFGQGGLTAAVSWAVGKRHARGSDITKRSDRRILTSHVGSLPRADALIEIKRAKFVGEAYDASAYATRLSAAVEEVCRKQAEIGVDVINDGRLSRGSRS